MEGFIVGIGRPRERVGIIDLEVVPAEVYKVTVITEQERDTECGNFGVSDNLHVEETGIIDITFTPEAEDVLGGEGTRVIKYGRYFVGLLLIFRSWGLIWC